MRKRWAAVLLMLCVILQGLSGCKKQSARLPAPGEELLWQDKLIAELYPDKSAYRPGEEVVLTLILDNRTGEDFKGKVEVSVSRIEELEELEPLSVSLKAGETRTFQLSWQPPDTDHTGYLISARIPVNGVVREQRNTAVDVSSDWSRFPRYGYLCEFGEMSREEIEEKVEWLSKFHINGVQFYDWQDAHDKPLAGTPEAPEESWEDIAHRPVSGKTITDYIDSLHGKNMMAANYNLMFGAYEDYEEKGAKRQWGLYQDEYHEAQDHHPLSGWESDLYLMDPANAEWQEYLLNREADVFSVYDFDVLHIDTLGYRGYVYDYDGTEVDLLTGYESFLSAAEGLGKRLLLNPVNGFGAAAAAKSGVDFLYTELWPSSYPNYSHLKQAADANFDLSENQKACVIAAYMNYEAAGKDFNPHAVKLTDAVLFASGAGHLELGDTGMLSSEYFPNGKMTLSPELERDLRDYYDFFTAYETILRAPADRVELRGKLEGAEYSDDGSPGTVWMFGSENESWKAVQLINLLSRGDAQWRDDFAACEAPQEKNALTLRLPWQESAPKSVSLASPDIFGGSPVALDFRIEGEELLISVPYLEYWDMVLVKK